MHQLRHGINDIHEKAAEDQDLATHAHRTTAEDNGKGDNGIGNWHLERALEHSNRAYKLAQKAHSRSGRMEPFS
jgi:hypothetical protein